MITCDFPPQARITQMNRSPADEEDESDSIYTFFAENEAPKRCVVFVQT